MNKFKPTDIVFFEGIKVYKNAKNKKNIHIQPYLYYFYTKDYFDKYLKNSWKKFSEKEIITRMICNDKSDKTNNFVQDAIVVYSIKTDAKSLPQYPGGMEEFANFFKKNFKSPSDFKGNGKVYVSFAVDTDGSTSEFQILRDLGFGTGEEAIRVLKTTPKWIPGNVDGKDVKKEITLPINIVSK